MQEKVHTYDSDLNGLYRRIVTHHTSWSIDKAQFLGSADENTGFGAIDLSGDIMAAYVYRFYQGGLRSIKGARAHGPEIAVREAVRQVITDADIPIVEVDTFFHSPKINGARRISVRNEGLDELLNQIKDEARERGLKRIGVFGYVAAGHPDFEALLLRKGFQRTDFTEILAGNYFGGVIKIK